MYVSEKAVSKDAVPANNQILEKFYSVQFAIDGRAPLYQFKIKNVSPGGPGILIGRESAVLSRLKIGEEFDMTYCPCGCTAASQKLRTKVSHINHHTEGRLEGYVAVGLDVIGGM